MAVTKTFSSYDYVGKDGRYLSLTITETSTDASTNTSNIKWSLSTNGGTVPYYDTFCLIKINGQQVYFSNGTLYAGGYSGWITSNNGGPTGIWYDANGNENTCAKWGFSTSGTINNIVHNNNGTKTINVVFLVGCFYYVVRDCGGSITLTTVDRSAPTITQSNPTSITYNSCTISASANVNCSKWYYRKKLSSSNTWESWIEINSSGTSKSVNITGLSPNASYDFQWKAKKASNGVEGESGIKSITTLGASILNSVSNIYVDVSSPTLTYNMTAYSNTFYHRLILTKGGSSITINLGTRTANTSSYTYTFTSSEVSTLIGWIGSSSYTATGITVTLNTYTDSNYNSQIGSSSVISNALTVIIREANALPTLSVDGYEDINSTSISATGNRLYIIPNSSSLRINNIVGSTKLGATISSIVVKSVNQNITKSISGVTGTTSYNSNFTWGTVTADTGSYYEITLTDSRGKIAISSVAVQIYRKGALIKISDYNNWYDILSSHYNAKDYNGNYYISGTTSSGFNLPDKKSSGKEVLASDINSTTNGIYKHADSIPISSSNDYYYNVRTAINNLKNATISTSVSTGDLVDAATKSTIDSSLESIDNIILFNLIKE